MTPTTPAAGTDPAFFAGLVPPQSGEPGKTGSAQDAAADAIPAALKGTAGRKPAAAKAQEPEAEPEPEAATPAKDADDVLAGTATDADADAEDDDADVDADVDDGKPVFEAADRRAAIIADRRGVTFTLDEEAAEFRWDEIGAVEIDTPRFGKRFSVTVYTSTRRWFQCDVEAGSRSQLKVWTAELDAVLDARFEDEKPEVADTDDAADADETVDADGTENAADTGNPAVEEPQAEATEATETTEATKATKATKATEDGDKPEGPDAKAAKNPKGAKGAKGTKSTVAAKAKDAADA